MSEASAHTKCVIWDLDGTLWDGTLVEDECVVPRQRVIEQMRILDQRGILHSIASRNERDSALQVLRSFGLEDLFVFPQIGWEAKSTAVRRIATRLGFALETLALVDDSAFERAEVAAGCPGVLCIEAEEAACLADRPEMMSRQISPEARRRRVLYQEEERRREAEAEFDGVPEEFLRTLGLRVGIRPAEEGDLERAEELTRRTSQLNTTGYPYDRSTLEALRRSADHELLVCLVEDRFGSYGTVGLCLLAYAECVCTVKLLVVSCRVISRGVGTILLTHVMHRAHDGGMVLRAELVPTERNRPMRIVYRLAGFRTIEEHGPLRVLEWDRRVLPRFPDYARVDVIP